MLGCIAKILILLMPQTYSELDIGSLEPVMRLCHSPIQLENCWTNPVQITEINNNYYGIIRYILMMGGGGPVLMKSCMGSIYSYLSWADKQPLYFNQLRLKLIGRIHLSLILQPWGTTKVFLLLLQPIASSLARLPKKMPRIASA